MNVRLLGYPASITSTDAEARTALQSVLGNFVDSASSGDRHDYELVRDEHGWHVLTGETASVHGMTLADSLRVLEGQIVSDMLAAHPDRFHLHGAALLTPSRDSSVLILGDSGSGKTTLALALMARGFLPFSDDVIVMETDWCPMTFRRAFHVDDATRALIEEMRDAPGWVFGEWPAGYFVPRTWAESKASVRTILFPRRRGDAAPEATRLTIPEAATTLLPFSATLDRAPAVALGAASQLTAQARCYAVISSDLTETADLVLSLLRKPNF